MYINLIKIFQVGVDLHKNKSVLPRWKESSENTKSSPVISEKVKSDNYSKVTNLFESEEYSLLLSGYIPAVAMPGTVESYPVATSDHKVSLRSIVNCDVSISLFV